MLTFIHACVVAQHRDRVAISGSTQSLCMSLSRIQLFVICCSQFGVAMSAQLQCVECGKKISTYSRLMRHCETRHAGRVPSWLDDAAADEKRNRGERVLARRRFKRALPMSTLEVDHITPALDLDRSRFHCKGCNVDLNKVDAKMHFICEHGMREKDLRDWIVLKDVKTIRKRGSLHGCIFETYFESAAPADAGTFDDLPELIGSSDDDVAADETHQSHDPAAGRDVDMVEDTFAGECQPVGRPAMSDDTVSLPSSSVSSAPSTIPWTQRDVGAHPELHSPPRPERFWQNVGYDCRTREEHYKIDSPSQASDRTQLWRPSPSSCTALPTIPKPSSAPVATQHELIQTPKRFKSQQPQSDDDRVHKAGSESQQSDVDRSPNAPSVAEKADVPSPMKAALESMQVLIKGIELTTDSQKLQVRKEAREWVSRPSDDPERQRHGFPFRVACRIDMRDFVSFLVQGIHLDRRSAAIYEKSLRRFMDMIEAVDGSPVNMQGLLVNCWQSGIWSTLQTTPIFSSSMAWTRHMVTALRHYLQFQRTMFFNRDDQKALAILNQTQDTVFKPISKLIARSRKSSGNMKRTNDAMRLEHVAPPDTVRTAVRQSMVDLHTIHAEYGGTNLSEFPRVARIAANAIAVGIVFTNQLAGRSHEWEAMTDAHATEQIQSGKSYFVATEHKTASKFGAIGKYVADGTKTALLKYLELPRVTSKLFEPSKAGRTEISVATCLRKFHKMYLPGYEPMTVNLYRKAVHTKLKSAESVDKCMDLLCRVDAHSKTMGENVYNASTPKTDAATSKLLFEAFMGSSVAWPSADEIEALKRPITLVVSKFGVEKDASQKMPDQCRRGFVYNCKAGRFVKLEVARMSRRLLFFLCSVRCFVTSSRWRPCLSCLQHALAAAYGRAQAGTFGRGRPYACNYNISMRVSRHSSCQTWSEGGRACHTSAGLSLPQA